MKKSLIILPVLIIAVLTSCSNYPNANIKKLDRLNNDLNNMILNKNNSTFAYYDNTLFYQEQSETVFKGVYAQQGSEINRLDNGKKISILDRSFAFFTFNNIQFMRELKDDYQWYYYDKEEKGFLKISNIISLSELKNGINNCIGSIKKQNILIDLNQFVFLGDNYYVIKDKKDFLKIVYFSCKKGNFMKTKQLKIEKEYDSYYIYKDSIFIVNEGCIYKLNIKKDNQKLIYITSYDSFYTSFIFCDDKVIYYVDNVNGTNSLYEYSLASKKTSCVFDKDITAINVTLGEKSIIKDIIVSTNDGIYLLNNKENKISNLVVDQIYIFDKKWIYIRNSLSGEQYRITYNGKKTECFDSGSK